MGASINRNVVTYDLRYRSGMSSGPFLSFTFESGEGKLDVDQVDLQLAPAMSRIVVSHQRGLILEAGTRQKVDALDLRGKQLRMDLTSAGQGTVRWYFYVPDQSDSPDATSSLPIARPTDPAQTVYSGQTAFVGYGLEYHLGEVTLQDSITDAGRIDEMVPFNLSATGGGIEGNRTASKSGGSYRFASSNTTKWTAQDVAEYLIRYFNDATGESWSIAGQDLFLGNVVDVWRFHAGQSIFDALNQVIGARYGFAWYLTKASDSAQPVVRVVSTLDTSYNAGDIAIPANSNVVALDLDDSPSIRRATWQHIENAHYDTIVARGGPIRTCFTMHKGRTVEFPTDIDYGTIAKGWDDATETAYSAEADDESRQDPTYRSVWRDFVLPTSWDGYQDTPTISNNNCIPAMDQSDEDFPVDVDSQQTKYYRDWRIDPIIPLKDTTSGSPRWRPPLVICLDRSTSKYVDMLAPPDGYTPVGVAALDDRPGIRLVNRYAHQFGLNAFSGSSDFDAALDWRDTYFTVMMATNERLAWSEDAATAYPGPIDKTLIIDVPEAELWFMAGSTIKGIEGDGTSLDKVGPGGEVIRNDLDTLKRVAQAAAAWYARRRTKLNVQYSHCNLVLDNGGSVRLGHVVSETDTGSSVEPTGTIISRITYRLGTSQSSEFQTEWRDLGAAGLVRGARGDQGVTPGLGSSYRPRARERAPEIIVPPTPSISTSSGPYNCMDLEVLSGLTVQLANSPRIRVSGNYFKPTVTGVGSLALTATTVVGLQVKLRVLEDATEPEIYPTAWSLVDMGANAFGDDVNEAISVFRVPITYTLPLAEVTIAGGVITGITQLAWGIWDIARWTGGIHIRTSDKILQIAQATSAGIGYIAFTPGTGVASYIYAGLVTGSLTIQLSTSGLTSPRRIGYVETDGSGNITLLRDYTSGLNDISA